MVFEQSYYAHVGTVRHLWNGRWGRLGRRDVWLRRIWRVEWRKGDGDSPVHGRDFDEETAARVFVAELLRPDPKRWREMPVAPPVGNASPPAH